MSIKNIFKKIWIGLQKEYLTKEEKDRRERVKEWKKIVDEGRIK